MADRGLLVQEPGCSRQEYVSRKAYQEGHNEEGLLPASGPHLHSQKLTREYPPGFLPASRVSFPPQQSERKAFSCSPFWYEPGFLRNLLAKGATADGYHQHWLGSLSLRARQIGLAKFGLAASCNNSHRRLNRFRRVSLQTDMGRGGG